MGFAKTVGTRDFVLMEAGIIETLRRRDNALLHSRLENALLIYEKDGENAFEQIDAICEKPPFGYMVNCAYPTFLNADQQPAAVMSRLIGYQANASALDHAQLDGSETLQAEKIPDWGNLMIALNRKFGVKILGGCCGTGYDYLRYLTGRLAGAPIKPELSGR